MDFGEERLPLRTAHTHRHGISLLLGWCLALPTLRTSHHQSLPARRWARDDELRLSA
jgi:hypothetical protein